MRVSALALTSALGVGIPMCSSSVAASEKASATKRTNIRSYHRREPDGKERQRRKTEITHTKMKRKFHSLPPKPISAASFLRQRAEGASSHARIQNFELCELSSRSRMIFSKEPSDTDLDLGILSGCSSEKEFCILPNLVGFENTSASESISSHYVGYDGQPIFDHDEDEEVYSKIAMGICYPSISIDEFYVSAVTKPIEDHGTTTSTTDTFVHTDSEDVIHTNAPTETDSYGYYHTFEKVEVGDHTNAPTETDSYGYYHTFEKVEVGDHTNAPTETDSYGYYHTFDNVEVGGTDDGISAGDDRDRDLLSIPSFFKRLRSSSHPETKSMLRMAEINEEISQNALTQRDSHYLECMHYCSEFDRPQIAEWLAENPTSYDWPEFEGLVAKCLHAHHYVNNLGFEGIPHYCPFDVQIPLNCWNMTGVTSLETAFRQQSWFNEPLGCWDTSSVTSTAGMFTKAYAFNQDIAMWDTSLVEDMTEMFYFAVDFDRPLGHWDTGKVTDISRMFAGANRFNSHINSWDVSRVGSMHQTFFAAQAFNQSLASWNTSSLTALDETFVASFSFNQPIGSWDISGVTSLRSTFMNAHSFNQPLNTWDVSNVVDMDYTFLAAMSFNQPLDENPDGDAYWNVKSARSMKQMFFRTSFDQCLWSWPAQLSAHDEGVNATTATYAMFYEAQCSVEMEMGTPPIDDGPWCQGESQGCYKTRKAMLGKGSKKRSFSKDEKSSKSSKTSKSSKNSHHIN